MSLPDWCNNGWLVEHQTDKQEINELLTLIDRDLSDCQTSGLSTDWKFNIAYNAALQSATAALAAAGFRAAHQAHHFRTIQALEFTVGLDSDTINQLQTFRKKRNLGNYQRAGSISDQQAGEMIDLA